MTLDGVGVTQANRPWLLQILLKFVLASLRTRTPWRSGEITINAIRMK
jgi:hypothetical protein